MISTATQTANILKGANKLFNTYFDEKETITLFGRIFLDIDKEEIRAEREGKPFDFKKVANSVVNLHCLTYATMIAKQNPKANKDLIFVSVRAFVNAVKDDVLKYFYNLVYNH